MSDESFFLTEEYVMNDREAFNVLKEITESGIFDFIESECLVLVKWEEIRNYEKTYAEAKPTARVASLEPGNHPKGILTFRGKLMCCRVIDHAKAFAKQQVSNRADLQRYEYYYRISKRPLKNLVPSPKEWSDFLERPFEVIWDLENCNIPAELSPEEAVNNIKAYVKCKFRIDEKYISILAYADFSKMCKLKMGLEKAGVVVKDTPIIKKEKDVVVKALIYELGIHANLDPEPYSIMLISGSVDYVNPLQDLHDNWGHNIVLAIPSESWVLFDLTDVSDSILYWPNVVRGKDEPTLSLEIRKGKMLLEEKPSVKVAEEIPNVQVSEESQLLSLHDATLIESGDLTDVVRGDQSTLSLQNKKGTKEWSDFSKRPFVAFWDLENCNIPAKVSTEEAVNNIKAYVKRKFGIDEKNITILACADFSEMSKRLKMDLENAGVVVKDTPKKKDQKDVADKELIYHLGIHAKIYREPYSIMLISGDVDFVHSLGDLRNRGHYIVLAIPSGSWVWFNLTDASDYCLCWPNVVKGGDQPNLSLQRRNDKMRLLEKPSMKLMKLVEEEPSVKLVEDQPTSSLQNKKGKMPLLEVKPPGKLVKETPSVKFSVKSELQLLSLNDATPIQSDLTGRKAELVKFLVTSSRKPLDLTRLKGGLVESLEDSSGNRTLLALLRNIGKS